MAIDLKKKVGPLPVWGWAVLGAGSLGVIYYLRRSSSSSNAATQSDAALAAEQQAAQDGYGYAGDAGGAGASQLPANLATGATSTDQIDSDLASGFADLQASLADLAAAMPVDTQPSTTVNTATPTTSLAGLPIKKQLAMVASGAAPVTALGPNALKTFEHDLNAPAKAGSSSVPAPKGASPTANGKSIAGLTIVQQLDDLGAGLITKAQLGPNAAAALSAAGGNVNKAIAARESKTTAANSGATSKTNPAKPKTNPTAVKKATE